jgi:hypothetical protein
MLLHKSTLTEVNRAYAAVGGSEVGQRPQYSGAAAWPETDSTVESLPVLHIHRDCAGHFESSPSDSNYRRLSVLSRRFNHKLTGAETLQLGT